jgi:hypothetical protein
VGNAEIALALSTLGTLLVGVLAYVGKDAHGDVKGNTRSISDHDRRLAVLEASQLHATVGEHGVRLTAIENGFAELKGDMRELSSDMRYVKRWVESQSDPSQHRRASDRKGD